jgi:hypothetical protein
LDALAAPRTNLAESTPSASSARASPCIRGSKGIRVRSSGSGMKKSWLGVWCCRIKEHIPLARQKVGVKGQGLEVPAPLMNLKESTPSASSARASPCVANEI